MARVIVDVANALMVGETSFKGFQLATQLSLVEHIHQRGPDGPKYVQPATWFVSHAWRYKFLDVIDALDTFFDETGDEDDVAVWFCTFNNNQHEISSGKRPFAFWYAKFKDSLTAIGQVVMVFSPWHNPTTLTRTWCVFEVLVAIDTNARFEVAMTKAAKAAFLQDTASPDEIVSLAWAKINCATSTTAKPSDRDHIFELIDKGPGFAKVDRMVFQVLEAWVRRTLDTQLDKAKTRRERLQWQFADAELYLQEMVTEDDAPDGEYWQAVAMLAFVQFRLQRPRSSWAPRWLDALTHLEEMDGCDDPVVLHTKNGFAQTCFTARDDYDRGLALQYECFASANRLWGDAHERTIQIMGHLGFHLGLHFRRFDEAATWLERAIDASSRLHGNATTPTFLLKCLAECYRSQGRFLGATPLARRTYDGYLRMFGPHGKQTIMARVLVCNCLRNEGHVDDVDLMDELTACLHALTAVDDDVLIVPSMSSCVCSHIKPGHLVARKLRGELWLSRGDFARAQLEFDDILPKHMTYFGVTDCRTRHVLYAQVVLLALDKLSLDQVHARLKALDTLQANLLQAEIHGHTWLDFECHGCYAPIHGTLYMCPACPRLSLRFCTACAQYKSKCTHSPTDWIRVSPPMRFVLEERLALLAKTKAWSQYARHYKTYSDHCVKHGVREQLQNELPDTLRWHVWIAASAVMLLAIAAPWIVAQN
ncbi:Aste57867_4404 [Aphanomyces stellatus]|uniref:Aste57867_4404 protein n=1 Tax=Aphanomyces stellatus TaxID=120398 RepID=A0A485KGR4_9STRA|nr:hypothetical protein As57867_004392 [Aphanomyces stellatus]VFT81516.1 Aste57867_4404 [Aphanomyces stellatus]